MELPDTCPSCHAQNMIDWETLERRPLSNLYMVEGYSCPHCSRWKPCFYTTRQLDENMKRLAEFSPAHSSFYYHFVKTAKRADEIQKRGRKLNVEIRIQDLAPA